MVVQWRDCIPGRGNSMGIRSVVMTFWMLTALTCGIGVSRFAPWWWGVAAGLGVMVAQRGIVELVERSGMLVKQAMADRSARAKPRTRDR